MTIDSHGRYGFSRGRLPAALPDVWSRMSQAATSYRRSLRHAAAAGELGMAQAPARDAAMQSSPMALQRGVLESADSRQSVARESVTFYSSDRARSPIRDGHRRPDAEATDPARREGKSRKMWQSRPKVRIRQNREISTAQGRPAGAARR